jgi:hypothetical protein
MTEKGASVRPFFYLAACALGSPILASYLCDPAPDCLFSQKYLSRSALQPSIRQASHLTADARHALEESSEMTLDKEQAGA